VRLVEAEIATGGLILALADNEAAGLEGAPPWARWGRAGTEAQGRVGRPLRHPQSSKGKAGKQRAAPLEKKTKRQPSLQPSRPTGKSGRGRGKRH
jgi:hypothetical protein